MNFFVKKLLLFVSVLMLTSWTSSQNEVFKKGTNPEYSKISAKNPDEAWISEIRINSKKIESVYEPDGYSDFSKIHFRVSRSKGFWLAGKTGNGTKLEHRWSVWIDFDKDGLFEDWEKFMESTQFEFSRKLRLPEEISTDDEFRVRIFFGVEDEETFVGEFEDYSLKIIK